MKRDRNHIKRQTLELFAQLNNSEKGSDKWVRLRQKIALLNEGLALKVAAAESRKTSYDSDDIKSLAMAGLMKAIDKYDISTGNAFSSIAVPTIRSEIVHFLRDYGTLIKARIAGENRDTAKATLRELQKLGRNSESLSLEYAAVNGLQITAEKWQTIEVVTSNNAVRSLDVPKEGAEFELPDNRAADYAERANRLAQQDAMRVAVGKLPDSSKRVVMDHYWNEMSPSMIAKRRGTTQKEIEIILEEALPTLRNFLYASN